MRRISKEVWDQIKTAYASGIGLREIARKMGIAEGTVLARAKREKWTAQIQEARAIVPCDVKQSDAIALSPVQQSAAAVMQQRGERYRERIAGVSERVVGHIGAMCLTKFSPAVRNLRKSTRLRAEHSD